MLIEYPIKFDDTIVPSPDEWIEKSSAVERISTTEAGTDQIAVIRYDKLQIICAFSCTSRWTAEFKKISKKDSVDVNLYDIETAAYKCRQMRVRDFKAKLVKESETTKGTNGLWKITFKLEEF